jgi:hypothetical protein
MSTKSTPDAQPKRRRVVADKQSYFIPDHNVTVEADTAGKAVELAQKQTNQEEVGDGE